MGKLKSRSQPAGMARAWVILLSVVAVVSAVTATTTAWFLGRTPKTQAVVAPSESPLSVAEREGTFGKMKAALRWPSLNFGIEGNALVIEGEAESDRQIEEVLRLVKSSLRADSIYIVHPYIQRPDWITGRIQAMREGDYDYKKESRSVFVVNLLRVAKKNPVADARDTLREAQRVLDSVQIPPPLEIEKLKVDTLPLEREEVIVDPP